MSNDVVTPSLCPGSQPPPQPVRIALVATGMMGGGVSPIVMGYYRNIDRSKIQYDFFLADWEAKAHAQAIQDLGGRVFVVPQYNNQKEYQPVLYRYFKQNKYPLVYSHINSLSVFPLFAAWRAGIPIRIAHSHSVAGKGQGEFKRNVYKNILRQFSRVFPTHMCACSQMAGRWLFGKKAVASGRFRVWLNAMEIDRFRYSEQDRQTLRQELGLDGKFVVGHVGRFRNQKNHTFLVDIFAEIHKRRENAVLLLVGGGSLTATIRQKIHGLGLDDCTIFSGWHKDIERYYQAMDMFVFPSLYEGFGNVAAEAQISGLPILCSTNVPDEVRLSDACGFMSLKESAGTWADEALRIYDSHPRKDMSSAAREAGFDIKEQGAKMTQWYCELLGI